DNIYLHNGQEGEVVKVVDFGIAKLMDKPEDIELGNLTLSDGIIGTPTYMSPERLSNKAYDGRSDVYSLGIVMYEMLSGAVPFDDMYQGIVGLILMHLKEDPPPLREINPDIPVAIEDIVNRTLLKDPNLRPTAKELAQELRTIAGTLNDSAQ